MFRAVVVDDIEIIRSRISSQINESRHPIVVSGIAENGEEAIGWLDKNYADICITDIKMPVMDGLELIRIIKEKYPWMVSFIISSYDDFAYAKKSIQLNAVDYILKPVGQEQLEEALENAVDRIVSARTLYAESLLLNHRNEWDKLLVSWLEYIKLEKSASEAIIEQTINKISELVSGNFFLMPYVASKWIAAVTAELNICAHQADLNKYDSNTAPLLRKDIKDVFTNSCRSMLKEALECIQKKLGDLKGGYHRKIIDKLIDYVHSNYTRSDFSLQEMAEYAAMSKNYMSNLFKQEMGVTIWNYIIELRMKKAKELLSDPNTKNFEVATSVGYTDYIHFSRLFKQYNGLSAQDYRKKSGGL